VPTVDLPDDELAAVTAVIRRAIEDDKYPHAPRLVPLLTALWKFEAATADRKQKIGPESLGSNPTVTRKATEPHPKAPPPAKADKRARR
jgi:hypothetical protein